MTYSLAAANYRLQVIADLIAGLTPAISTGGTSVGTLVIGDSTLSGSTGVIATFQIQTTVVSNVANGVLTIPLVTNVVTATGSGTAAKAELRNNAGTVIDGSLTVGTSIQNVVLSGTVITAGDTITLTSASITHPHL